MNLRRGDIVFMRSQAKVSVGPFLRVVAGQDWWVATPLNVNGLQRRIIVESAQTFVDRPYGYWKVFAHALDSLLLGAYVFRRFARMDAYPICSYVVAAAYAEAGLDFGVSIGRASPDDIWDFCRAHPEKYRFIRQGAAK